jgi:hypothetical protein
MACPYYVVFVSTATNMVQPLYRVKCTVSTKGGVLEAALWIAEDIAGRRRKVGLRNDEGWLQPWTTGERAHTQAEGTALDWTPLTVDQIIRTALLLEAFTMLQISPFFLHANAFFRLLGYLLQA